MRLLVGYLIKVTPVFNEDVPVRFQLWWGAHRFPIGQGLLVAQMSGNALFPFYVNACALLNRAL